VKNMTSRERKTLEGMLAMAKRGATPAERQNAAAMAAEWMTRRGIRDAQALAARGELPEAVGVLPYAVPGIAGLGQARATAAIRIAQALDCIALLDTPPTDRAGRAVIIGVTSELDSLRTLLPLVLATAEQHAAQAAADKPATVRVQFVARFLVGYAEEIAQRMSEKRKRLRAGNRDAASTLEDWVRRVRALADEKFPERGSTAAIVGNEAGRAAGRAANIGEQVANTSTSRALISG
jgi:hypothetical protein